MSLTSEKERKARLRLLLLPTLRASLILGLIQSCHVCPVLTGAAGKKKPFLSSNRDRATFLCLGHHMRAQTKSCKFCPYIVIVFISAVNRPVVPEITEAVDSVEGVREVLRPDSTGVLLFCPFVGGLDITHEIQIIVSMTVKVISIS